MVQPDYTASWWRKVDRAQELLNETAALLALTNNEVTSAIRVERRRNGSQWEYTAHTDAVVPANLPAIVGDFLFDLVCALDHIAAANVTGGVYSQSNFPIYATDYRDPNSAESRAEPRWATGWRRAVERFPDPIRLAVESVQPFVVAPQYGGLPENDALAVLNDRHNADKHSSLSVVVQGTTNLVAMVIRANGIAIPFTGQALGEDQMLPNGGRFWLSAEEAEVEVAGTVQLAVGVGTKAVYRWATCQGPDGRDDGLVKHDGPGAAEE